MTVENNTKKTVATTDGLAGTADPVTSTMRLFTEVPGFTALSFATAAAFGAFSLMLPVIPLAVILTTGSDTLAGATTMVFMAVTVATQLVTNRIIRRYGYRRVMLAAAFLLGVPTLWYLVSMDTASLLLVAAVRGMGFGSLCVAQFALVAHIAPPGALGRRRESSGCLPVPPKWWGCRPAYGCPNTWAIRWCLSPEPWWPWWPPGWRCSSIIPPRNP